MALHVAILLRPYLRMILRGCKTIESRFTMRPLPPYRRIRRGDVIYFKASAGPYMARAKAGPVEFFDNLTVARMREINRQHYRAICCSSEFWRRKRHSRDGTLIWLNQVQPVTAGPSMPPSRGPAWFVLDAASPTSPVMSCPAPRAAMAPNGSFQVVLTPGAIRNCYVVLPAEEAAGLRGRQWTLRMPDGQEVVTSVVASRLRWRGWGRYFRTNGVHPGNSIRFTRTSPWAYRVTFPEQGR